MLRLTRKADGIPPPLVQVQPPGIRAGAHGPQDPKPKHGRKCYVLSDKRKHGPSFPSDDVHVGLQRGQRDGGIPRRRGRGRRPGGAPETESQPLLSRKAGRPSGPLRPPPCPVDQRPQPQRRKLSLCPGLRCGQLPRPQEAKTERPRGQFVEGVRRNQRHPVQNQKHRHRPHRPRRPPRPRNAGGPLAVPPKQTGAWQGHERPLPQTQNHEGIPGLLRQNRRRNGRGNQERPGLCTNPLPRLRACQPARQNQADTGEPCQAGRHRAAQGRRRKHP